MMGKKEQKRVGRDSYNTLFKRMKNLTISMFEWKNVPATVNLRYLEEMLFEQGRIAWIDLEGRGVFALQCTLGGQLNMYNEPTTIRTVSVDQSVSKAFELYGDDCVLMWNDYSRSPTRNIVEMFAKRIHQIERTIDLNVYQQRTPNIVMMKDEKQLLAFKNLFKDYEAYEPVTYASKKLGDLENDILIAPFKSDYVSDKLTDLKHDYWNEFYTFVGIGNANTDKRERLNGDEVNANNGQILAQREIMLKERQAAVKIINEKFGLNISVDYAERIIPEPKEGEEHGEVHNTTENNTK